MKHGTTTPVSAPSRLSSHQGIVTRSLLVAAAVVMVMSAPLTISTMATADTYDQQIKAIKSQINQYEDEASKLGKKVGSLEARLKQLSLERSAIKAELKLTQTRYDQLNDQIAKTEQKIIDNQNALGTILADLYISGSVTPLEMLASSNNIGDFIDKQAYQSAIRHQLVDAIARVEVLKEQLEADQQEVEKVLVRQQAQERSLAAKEAQQHALVAETKNQQSAYQQLVSQSQQRLKSVSQQQRDYYQSRLASGDATSGVVGDFSYANWSGNQGCGGGYPDKWCVAQDTVVDDWALYNRECVSYVAWALENRFDKYVAGFNGEGNAMDWPSSAVRYSGAQIVNKPQPGDAVILPASGDFAPIGHAMIVESVDGGTVHVSQYNFYGTGEYSTMDIGTGGVYFLRFQDQ